MVTTRRDWGQEVGVLYCINCVLKAAHPSMIWRSVPGTFCGLLRSWAFELPSKAVMPNASMLSSRSPTEYLTTCWISSSFWRSGYVGKFSLHQWARPRQITRFVYNQELEARDSLHCLSTDENRCMAPFRSRSEVDNHLLDSWQHWEQDCKLWFICVSWGVFWIVISTKYCWALFSHLCWMKFNF